MSKALARADYERSGQGRELSHFIVPLWIFSKPAYTPGRHAILNSNKSIQTSTGPCHTAGQPSASLTSRHAHASTCSSCTASSPRPFLSQDRHPRELGPSAPLHHLLSSSPEIDYHAIVHERASRDSVAAPRNRPRPNHQPSRLHRQAHPHRCSLN